MRKVRAQVAAAAESSSNALVSGRHGSGRGHVARAIHYHANPHHSAKLITLDCELAGDDVLRRTLDSLRTADAQLRQRPTLLLENLQALSAAHQSLLLSELRESKFAARIVATCSDERIDAGLQPARTGVRTRQPLDASPDTEGLGPAVIEPQLLNEISTISVRIPRLVERLEDLPILVQSVLEECNRGNRKQIGSVRSDVLDQLALHTWPGELVELREVIAAAHASCTGDEITASHLPAVIHHAARAAAHARRPPPERIVLDDLLARIEREAIVRALAQAGGNKTDAAELLGMTRPRLYRRMVQLGLVQESPFDTAKELPEFIEQDSIEPSS
jgi:DNA-binding NtrC family response regulator